MTYAGSPFRFDNFVVGPANRLAVAAARAVAEGPGTVYNPLVVYGASGLGKTHLLGAIATHATHLQPELTVEQLPTEEFVGLLSTAVATGQLDAFTRRFTQADLLLLDDIQQLTGHRETQTALLRLFNQLQSAGRQIVMTSDRMPQDIPDVDERLVTRLAGGLAVDIAAPDYETRVAILEAKCRERGVELPRAALEQLAAKDVASVRELQGLLHRSVAERELLAGAGPVARPTPVVAMPAIGAPAGAPAAAPRPGEFESFVQRLTAAVSQHVEPPWRTRIADAIGQWRAEGYATGLLERALQAASPPDVDALLRRFSDAVRHLRQLEQRAFALDPAVGAGRVFRDPEQLREAEAIVDRLLAGTAPPPAPDPALTRDGYDVGNTNQLAVRAADVVIGEPGARYNPLVITGPAGVGKTHLLHAIGNALQARQELPLRVACVGAAKYSEELILALREDTLARWRARYRAADVLLFDDVHFLGGKERTQEELFHLLNVFRDLGKQVVLATEVPPRNLQRVEERIRTRLEEGLVVEIQPPDRLLRRKLVTRFFAQLGEDPDGEVVSLLADPVEATARELRQRVQRIHRTAREAGVAVSPAFVQGLADPVQDAPAIPAGSALPGADPFFLAGEKVVWEWPDLGGRMIEEFR